MRSGEKPLFQVQFIQQEVVRVDVEIKNAIAEIRESSDLTQIGLNEMSRRVKDLLNQMLELIKVGETGAMQIKKPSDRDGVAIEMKKLRDELDANHQSLRHATLRALRRIETETRSSLMEGGVEATSRKRVTNAQQMRSESSKATQNLTQLVSRMNDEVVRSGETLESLVRSSEVLKTTDSEFGNMGATIQSSGRLLSKYSRREFTDKILIALASCLFFATVLYIVQKRMFPRGFGLW